MWCRNCVWLFMTDKDTNSMSDGHSFSADLLFSIIKIFSTTSANGKCMRLSSQTRLTGNNFLWLTDGTNRNIIKIPYWG